MNSKCGGQSKKRRESHVSCVCIIRHKRWILSILFLLLLFVVVVIIAFRFLPKPDGVLRSVRHRRLVPIIIIISFRFVPKPDGVLRSVRHRRLVPIIIIISFRFILKPDGVLLSVRPVCRGPVRTHQPSAGSLRECQTPCSRLRHQRLFLGHRLPHWTHCGRYVGHIDLLFFLFFFYFFFWVVGGGWGRGWGEGSCSNHIYSWPVGCRFGLFLFRFRR